MTFFFLEVLLTAVKGKAIYLTVIVILLIIIAVGITYYLATQGNRTTEQLAPSPTTTTMQSQSTNVETVETTKEKTNIPQGWQTYKNQEYSFEISYPGNYKALDDENNLYGWPNGIVLIYGGGQSYDLPIEVWNSPSEYESKYQTQMSNLTVKNVKGKYITLLNMNQKPDVDQIIGTFKILE